MPWKHRKKFLSALREYFLQMHTNLKRQTAPDMLILTQLSINGNGPKVSITSSTEIQMKLRKFNEKQFACPHTLAEEEKKLMSFFSLAVVHRQRYFCTPPECSSALLTCAAMYTHRRCIPRACAVSDWAHAQVRRGSAV